MIKVSEEWNKNQAMLKYLLSSKGDKKDAVKLCLDMHSMLHAPKVSGISQKTYDDKLWDGLTENMFRILPEKETISVAWNIWHITRIEDLVTAILFKNEKQTLNNKWLNKLNTNVMDTGNNMIREKMQKFSNEINMKVLKNYREAVGKRTQQILNLLNPDELNNKAAKNRLNRIYEEGGVIEKSKWLLEFWGRKTIAGLILMPVTRHQVVHLNKAFRLKKKYSEKLS